MMTRIGYALIVSSLLTFVALAVNANGQSYCPNGQCQPQQPSYSAPQYGPEYQSGYWNDPGSKCTESDVVVRAGKGGGSYGVGSGTVIKSDDTGSWVLTNFHVVRVGDSGENVSNDISVVVPSNKDSTPAKYVAGDPVHDLAIVFIPRRLRPVAVAYDDPDGKRTYYVSGWRAGRYFSRRAGRVVGRGNVRGATRGSSAHLNVPAQSGQSGGCLYDERGCLAGVVWGSGDGQACVVVGTPLRNFLCRHLHLCCKPSVLTPNPEQSPPQDSAQAPAPPTSPPAATGASCDCGPKWEQTAAEIAQLKQDAQGWTSAGPRLDKLETQVSAIESQMVPVAQIQQTVVDLDARVVNLESKTQADIEAIRSEVNNLPTVDGKFHIRVRNENGQVSEYAEVAPGGYVTINLGQGK